MFWNRDRPVLKPRVELKSHWDPLTRGLQREFLEKPPPLFWKGYSAVERFRNYRWERGKEFGLGPGGFD